MSDKFSLYQTDGLWGIIENASNEKQKSIKSYFGSDLIIKRLNEQADQIDQLKQQLDEKDEEINSLIADYEKRISQEQELMSNMEHQLAEKDREIEDLNKTIEMCKHIERYDIGEMFFENAKLIIEKRQFAISELEKVKKLTENLLEKFCNSWEYNQKYMRGHRHIEYYDLIQGIDNQIKELKGEKDVGN